MRRHNGWSPLSADSLLRPARDRGRSPVRRASFIPEASAVNKRKRKRKLPDTYKLTYQVSPVPQEFFLHDDLVQLLPNIVERARREPAWRAGTSALIVMPHHGQRFGFICTHKPKGVHVLVGRECEMSSFALHRKH